MGFFCANVFVYLVTEKFWTTFGLENISIPENSSPFCTLPFFGVGVGQNPIRRPPKSPVVAL